MNNCALLDYNPPAPDCIAQVTPNRKLEQAILDQGFRQVEQLLQAQGGKTLEDFELPIPAQLAAPGDVAISEEPARFNVTQQAQQFARYVPFLISTIAPFTTMSLTRSMTLGWWTKPFLLMGWEGLVRLSSTGAYSTRCALLVT